MRRYIKNGTHLLLINHIDLVDYSEIENLVLVVRYHDGTSFTIDGIDALEAAMLLNPSCLEGKRLRWHKGAWHFHNLIGHPLTSILAALRLYKWAFWVHDYTVPKPIRDKSR